MTITALGSLNSHLGISREILDMRSTFDDLQRQLATGKRSESYAGLGTDRLTVLSVRSRVTTVDSYQSTIDSVQVRMDAMQQHLDRMREIVAETRSEILVPDFEIVNDNKTQAQVSAGERLNETLSLLNFELGGRHYFSGRTTEQQPVVGDKALLDGSGTSAGLRQVIDERRQADLGSDGLGRLAISNGGLVVGISEDAAGHPFGFKVAGISSTLSGTSVGGPVGSPAALDVTFTASLPQDGESVAITLDLPDGTQTTVTLTATTAQPPGENEFLIGTGGTDTAANFEAALNSSLQTAGRRDLAAASASQAGNEFFFYDSTNPPQRVDGPPFDSATGLRDATATDTVRWYRGDNGPGTARDTAVAHIDDTLNVSYGMRANEEPIAKLVRGLAVLASGSYSEADVDDPHRFKAVAERVAGDLNYSNTQSIDDIIIELGFKQRTLEDTSERHASAQAISQTLLQQKEGVDDYDVSTRLLRLQTSLQASFEATALLSRLSLVNFL